MSDIPAPPATREMRNTIVLVLAQALLGAQMPMIFTVGGLAGQMLSPNPCFATLPLSLIILGSVLSAQPMSEFMAAKGRRAGFILANAMGALGAATAAYALFHGSFALFMLGSFFTGTYMSAQGFYRFAATDTASAEFQPKAISYVMAGGLVAAIIGPQLVKVTSEAMVVPFMATYLAIIAINALGPILFSFLDIPAPGRRKKHERHEGRSRRELLKDPVILVAMICAMVSYALMNLVMTSTPLAVVGCGFEQADAANIVSAHVLAMYVPSFFTGHLIARFGKEAIVGTGLAILAAAGAMALSGVDLAQFYATLILLGLGWNFGFIGATAMLASAHSPEERGHVQGMNDFVVFGGVFLASLASGGLMNCTQSGNAQAGWQAVNLAMIPFLTLAGAALIWLVLRPKETR
ncbi:MULTISPECIES: MFS transporter [Thioclava]|uniref:MFS transporter n=1 Tax=Thioclava nitratireducens TaxID=1915078 RepID=A0ABM6IGC9_9RHOB|nr:MULTISPECIES: MFS transporter [Thioclava]AQS47852.1 MFS transporter [Thioclava nitratireducens]OWY07089.1 MFS transporter [Thioclava sp. IC9]OWY10696.1 MFS transporter [Thioclava sp. F42-5]OWY12675.1 MFS transporter [Thioclava sp. F34-6]OWY16985.1 MFS transporter [Thioclava sp. JM3]